MKPFPARRNRGILLPNEQFFRPDRSISHYWFSKTKLEAKPAHNKIRLYTKYKRTKQKTAPGGAVCSPNIYAKSIVN